ncbi:MAG: HAMP domain-containing protein [Anaerolineales bacterium]|nr:HAMP domain-containing protein [Anaerolineales bacterium]
MRHPSQFHPRHHMPVDLMAKQRSLILRFAFIFGLLVMLFIVGLLVVIALVRGPILGLEPRPRPAVWLFMLCGVPSVFLLLSFLLAGWIFRQVGTPVVEVMAAADAVAEGNFDVRVREDIPGEFGRLARSFNRMTAGLARAEWQRRNLTADVAHELRTPLHIIQGNLEGILDGVYEPTPENITTTLEETRLLARLVDDLQTLSLAEAGQLPLHPVWVPVVDLLQDVVASFSAQAAESGVDLQLDPDPLAQDTMLYADPDRIDQVLSNLVANALRYTPSGGKIVLGTEAHPGGMRIFVEDNGAGILAEDLPYIFDRFWRGDRARARHGRGGSGLGLAIARQLVWAHEGQISVTSQPGQGAKFVIELPVSGLEKAPKDR